MTETDDIIQSISHRPWTLPNGQWSYYQEWNNALFLHWKVSKEELTKLIPSNITLDTFDGESWISLVAFTMEQIRPRFLPSVSAISNFHEINIRTYLTKDNKPGVYFLNIEAGNIISSFLAKLLSGLPYEKAIIYRGKKKKAQEYIGRNKSKGFRLDTTFSVGNKMVNLSELDIWLTERYCLYFDKRNKLYRYEIQHKPWQLYKVQISKLTTHYKIGNISLNRKPDLAHYSDGVKVIAWQRQNIL